MQHKAVYYSVSSLYMFRVSKTPTIRSTQTVTTASGAGHIILCSYLPPAWPSWPRWREVAVVRPVPEAVVTVLCTPDDGCG